MDEQCSCEDLLSVIEDFIPMLIEFLSLFIFIVLYYRCCGKSRKLYWFMLISLFIFDLATLGFSIEYFPALSHIWNCACDDDV